MQTACPLVSSSSHTVLAAQCQQLNTASPLVQQVITPLLRILEKMHSMMLLHRDIKPENIFLTSMGKFKLGDFGLAIRMDKELAFSRSGTLDYMSPEVSQCHIRDWAWRGCNGSGLGWDGARLRCHTFAPNQRPETCINVSLCVYEYIQ